MISVADRLRYGAVTADDDDLALLVFTPKGQGRYVSLTTEQALACIESLASVLRQRSSKGAPDDRP